MKRLFLVLFLLLSLEAWGEPQPTTVHTVREGDTLYRIAKNSGIPLAELLEANGLTEKSVIRIGDVLTLPWGKNPAETPETAGEKKTPSPDGAETGFHPRWPLRSGAAGSRTARGSGLYEPASPGTAVYAPAPGTVLHSGWMKEYGNTVFIRHGEAFATFCGGLGIFYVTPGQAVTADTKIGLVGEQQSPGLWFHILRQGKAVNPEPFFSPSAGR